jgi:glycosyltransferase involved in cell wall biosynthesis
MKEVYLSIIIPAYNEEVFIEDTLNKILHFLAAQEYSYEIIVVNDGSSDKTGQIVHNLNLKSQFVKLISNEKCSGKGEAVRKGIKHSIGKYILVSDADYTYPIEQINSFLSVLEKGEYVAVVGNRRDSKTIYKLSPQTIGYVHSRHVISRIFNIIVNCFIIRNVQDTQCGFKCYRADFINNIVQKLTINNFAFDVEVLYLINKYGRRFCHLPVLYNYYNESSSIYLFKDSLKMLIALILIKVRDWRGLY